MRSAIIGAVLMLIAGGILILPEAIGQAGSDDLGEDFDDDGLGIVPGESWYGAIGYRAPSNPPQVAAATQVVACNAASAESDGNCLAIGGPGSGNCGTGGGSGGPCGLEFDFIPSQVDYVEFVMDRRAGTTGGSWTLCGGNNTQGTPSSPNCDVIGAQQIFDVQFIITGGNCLHRVLDSGGGVAYTAATLPDSGDCSGTWHIEFDWVAKTYTAHVNGGTPSASLPFHNNAAIHLGAISVAQGTIGSFEMDNLFLAGGFEPVTPDAPSGVSAVVTDADSGSPSDDGLVELRWLLSGNDPDQDLGDFEYGIFVDGINVATDSVTAADGDGIRFHVLNLAANFAPATFSFKLQAVNSTSGLSSTFSCSVSIDLSVLGDRDTCGSGAPGGPGSLDFTTPTDTAAGLSGFCSDLMGDSEASKFLCGLILVVIIFLGVGAAFAAMAGAPGMPAVIAGATASFGMMIFLVIAQIWSLGAAAVIILLATGVALALMRRLFFGGGSGGG